MRSVHIEKSVSTAVRPSPNVCKAAAMFGLGIDEDRRLQIIPPVDIPLPHDEIVFVTGPSGGGKSTILALIAQQCQRGGLNLLQFDDLRQPPEEPLVDLFTRDGLALDQAMSLLALAGLADAFVMLRVPSQLSDGQRYRLKVAQAIGMVESLSEPTIIISDEFGATLDRVTAMNIGRNIARWIKRDPGQGHCFVCATTHDDLLESLQPAVLVVKGLGESIEVLIR